MLQRRNSTLRAKQKPEVLHHRSPAGGLCESGFCREQVTYPSDTLVSYVLQSVGYCRKCSDRVRQTLGGLPPGSSAIGIPRISISAGVALAGAPAWTMWPSVRRPAVLAGRSVQDIERDPMPEATVGIGQHPVGPPNGVPNDTNAHPHTSRDGKVAIIHNGIIENASQLRLDLQTEGYHFVSETDTEVAAKLLGKISDKIIEETGKPDLFKAVRRLARMLEGAFTILATDVRQPDIVVGARHDSPLVVGLGEGGETSSAPTWPRSWPTPSAPWKSTKTRP